MRRKVRLTGLASAVSTLLAPEFVVGLPAFTRASAMTVATGAARAPIRGGAGMAVVAAVSVRGADARAGRAGVAGGAGIEIVARQGVWRVHAAGHRVARVGRAHVAVDAVGRRAADADAART